MRYKGFFFTTVLWIAVQPTWAKLPVKRHISHHTNTKKHLGSLYLTAAQRNNGFTNPNYANAYDELGRAIMKHDPDVKETSESVRDSSFGYYVILRRNYVSGAEAKRRAARYYELLVSIRQQYFSQSKAQICFVDVKNSGEETIASQDQDELRLGP